MLQALEKAEREAQQAQRTVDAARRRIDQFTSYTKRLAEDQNKMETEIQTGAAKMKEWRDEAQIKIVESVRRDAASTLVSLELAVSGGSDDDSRAQSVSMFQLLSRQVISGMGRPSIDQLAALWKRYDADGNGVLTKSELSHLLVDYAASQADLITKDVLPQLRRQIDLGGSNQYVLLLCRARIMAQEAKLALFKSQAEGQLAAADLNAAFEHLDTDHNGRISKQEFLAGAADVMFRSQMERLKVWQRVEQAE